MSTHVPVAWEFVLLALGAYRLTRLGGWDEFPLVAKIRSWAIGEEWVNTTDPAGLQSWRDSNPATPPGKTAEMDTAEVQPVYRRPTLAHLVHCPFCLGWWISLAVYAAFLAAPTPTLYAMTPFALSGVVGLVAKNLDP